MKDLNFSNYTGVDFPYIITTNSRIPDGDTTVGNVVKEGVIKSNETIKLSLDDFRADNNFYQFNMFKNTTDTYCISVFVNNSEFSAGDSIYNIGDSLSVYRLNPDVAPSTNPLNSNVNKTPYNDDLGAYIAPDGSLNVSSMDKDDFLYKDNGSCFTKLNPKDEKGYIIAVRSPEDTFGTTGTPSDKKCSGINMTWVVIILIIIAIIILAVIIGGIIYYKKRKSTG